MKILINTPDISLLGGVANHYKGLQSHWTENVKYNFVGGRKGIRQMLAATMFVFAIQFIQKRQLWKYVGTIVLASLFHTSAIVLLAFYFIPQKDFFKNRTLTFILVIITLVLGSMNFWVDNLMELGSILDFVGYDKMAGNLGNLVEDEEIRNIWST